MQLPDDRNTIIKEILEGKRFQIQTFKKIDSENNIRWTMVGIGWFTLLKTGISAPGCNGGYQLKGTEGFLKIGEGVLTFLKTTTQLQIWFDDVLEVTWVYEDSAADKKCAMRDPLNGLQFQAVSKRDTVSNRYRYVVGKCFNLLHILL